MDSFANIEDLHYYATKRQTEVSLKVLLETGLGKSLGTFRKTLSEKNGTALNDASDEEIVAVQVACFLHRELPVRLAHRATELEATPLLSSSKYVREVSTWYKQSFSELRNCQSPQDVASEQTFAGIVENIYERHSKTLIHMAKGAHEIRKELKADASAFADMRELQNSLDDFYASRISVRMLIGQYLALRQRARSGQAEDPDQVGLISKVTCPYLIAQQAIDDATYMCDRVHGDAPEVEIVGNPGTTFNYVPSHIHYILVELLKNSMRATVETHGISSDMPPIKLIIADGEDNEDVVIKVSDQGGGIPRSYMRKMWSYLFTTADPTILENSLDEDVADFDRSSPLAGLGYGLPIARNYARYFGGDLVIMSMEGYGTDSYIYLNRLGDTENI
jgi:pyruvate dehydrogenase kinase 2/3/4